MRARLVTRQIKTVSRPLLTLGFGFLLGICAVQLSVLGRAHADELSDAITNKVLVDHYLSMTTTTVAQTAPNPTQVNFASRSANASTVTAAPPSRSQREHSHHHAHDRR